MVRVEAGKVQVEPYASRLSCANGHRWTPESTRWRVRRDKGESSPTRDCLVCKAVSEGKRRKLHARRYM